MTRLIKNGYFYLCCNFAERKPIYKFFPWRIEH